MRVLSCKVLEFSKMIGLFPKISDDVPKNSEVLKFYNAFFMKHDLHGLFFSQIGSFFSVVNGSFTAY